LAAEKKEESKDGQPSKHESLVAEKEEGVEIMQSKKIKNVVSPFMSQTKSWDDDEHFAIPAEIQKGITEELGFMMPSKIQACAIPLIVNTLKG